MFLEKQVVVVFNRSDLRGVIFATTQDRSLFVVVRFGYNVVFLLRNPVDY